MFDKSKLASILEDEGLTKTSYSMWGVAGDDAAKDYVQDYPQGRVVKVRYNGPVSGKWTDNLWDSGAPHTKYFRRSRDRTFSLSGMYWGVAYEGQSSGQQMLDLFIPEDQTWVSLKEPMSTNLLGE